MKIILADIGKMGKISTLVSLGVRVGAVGATVYGLNQVGAFGDVHQVDKYLLFKSKRI